MRIIDGITRYRTETKPHYKELFSKLAKGQAPHALFITCADSRIDPELITGSEPGELFVLRNIGNIVPPFGKDSIPSEGAALEYALGVLEIKDAIVCGHSGCGAIQALLAGRVPPELHSLEAWMHEVGELCTPIRAGGRDGADPRVVSEVARENALHQLENLRTYPLVRERIASGKLRLHAWFFDIAEGDLDGWVEGEKRFLRLSDPNTMPESYR